MPHNCDSEVMKQSGSPDVRKPQFQAQPRPRRRRHSGQQYIFLRIVNETNSASDGATVRPGARHHRACATFRNSASFAVKVIEQLVAAEVLVCSEISSSLRGGAKRARTQRAPVGNSGDSRHLFRAGLG
jgi:hypothetical protein